MTAPVTDAAPHQFQLLRQRRFAPYFWTQFLGAGNDNLFKFALTVMLTYQLQLDWLPPAQAGMVIGGLFILPFVLFSATAGQIADRWDKARLMRAIKTLEIGIMALAAWGFWQVNVPVLLACVALMGLHSTLFGPVKFAYLPQHLRPRELTGGNGLVEMGTFVAILLGNVAGGLLMAHPEIGRHQVAIAALGIAVLGRVSAHFIPSSPSDAPELRLCWNPITETMRNLRWAWQHPLLFRGLLGISWMWFFGAVFLANFPAFARQVLHGNEQVASLLPVVFSVGVGVGSLLCERLSRGQVEVGLVPWAALGMTVFCGDLAWSTQHLPATTALLSPGEWLSQPTAWRVLADLFLLSLSAGLYSVPLYALVQLRTPPTHQARIMAANNILNAIYMIVSSLAGGALLGAGFSLPELFGLLAGLNLVAVSALVMRQPEFLQRAGQLLRGQRPAPL